MSPDALNSLFSLCIGFAFAGALASGYQALVKRPAGFGLLQQGVAPQAFAAVPFLVFAAPFIIMRNTLRGDNEWIEIGENSNVQDNSTCHTDMGFPLVIGRNCTVGHNVILHGCTIEEDALVGMGSIVMNGARIGRGSVVGAGSVITEGKQFPEYSLIIGSPARAIRTLDPAQVARMGSAAKFYVANGARFKKGMRKIG